ncbi:uncharacterized protein LOC144639071 [Oculina patagonica]
MWFIRKGRSLASQCSIWIGFKICTAFSIFLLYHVLLTALLPLKIMRSTHSESHPAFASWAPNITTIKVPIGNVSILGSTSPPVVKTSLRFLFVLHHYEQLSKTTENFLQLAAVAKQIGRVIVEPFVRDSRMCGLPYGWSGQVRNESQRFHPLSVYFDVKYMNNLLKRYHYAQMVKLETFKHECRSSVANTTLLHFMYNDQAKEEMKKWYKISTAAYQNIETAIKKHGWCKCNFIDHGLGFSKRIGDLKAGRQICIDARKIKSLQGFQTEILKQDKCTAIIHWRGLGKNRSQFKPEVNTDSHKLVHLLRAGKLVLDQAKRIADSIGQEYISIHVRSERQIQWYSVERLTQCLEALVEKVATLKQKHKINKVFLSSDFTQFGSDTLHSFTARNSTITNKIKQIQRFLSQTLKATTYKPRKDNPLLTDSGVVALTEMNVLIGGSHLVTVGSGTFQEWIVDAFVESKSMTKKQNYWTITRICHKEYKINNYKPTTIEQSSVGYSSHAGLTS